VTLTWDAPANDGGATVDHYVVYQDGIALANSPTGLTITISGLTNGQGYNFTLAAHNTAGTGPGVYVIVEPNKTVPTEPLNVTASSIDSAIVLFWSAPNDDGGYPITYSVLRGTAPGSESVLADIPGNSYTDEAIVLGTHYYYQIKAINMLGSSVPSIEIGPNSASTAILLDLETESSSSILAPMAVNGTVKTVKGGMPIEGLSISLSYSVNNGQTWIDMPSVNTTSKGNFSSQWIPTATGIYMLRGTWAGNEVYQPSTSTKSLAISATSDKYVFTVQSNSTISDLSFNSDSKKLSFNVTGEQGTLGYSRIVISKDLVANGSEIKVLLDGNETSYQLSSTSSSWILYFEYHHSMHSIVASLNEGRSGSATNLNDSPLPIVAMAGLAVVAVLLVAGLVLFNRRRGRK
jgi:fibronectin type 3 domain-containing protein